MLIVSPAGQALKTIRHHINRIKYLVSKGITDGWKEKFVFMNVKFPQKHYTGFPSSFLFFEKKKKKKKKKKKAVVNF